MSEDGAGVPVPMIPAKSKPLLLDLYCCEGGAAAGYARAGFEILGVDINPQPNYPYEFIQGDALGLGFLRAWLGGREIAAIHASPAIPPAYSEYIGKQLIEYPGVEEMAA